MNNIKFDNPWLLLLFIPFVLTALIPFLISVRKSNRNIHNVLSFILHIAIVVCITLVVAGINYEATITETNVYVLADVSYSSNNNLDVIDGYIKNIEDNLPNNSKLSVIAFAKNYSMLNALGEKTVSVKTANVDKSGTDIAKALRYAGSMFTGNTVKRIFIITDGQDTTNDKKIMGVVSQLKEKGIYIDAVYLDNTLTPDINEIQLNNLAYSSSTFKDKEEYVELLLNVNNESVARVYAVIEDTAGNEISRTAVTLNKGQNAVKVPLPTENEGTFEYIAKIVAPEGEDTCPYNNAGMFTQHVENDVKVLFLGSSQADILAGKQLYGEDGANFIGNYANVPYALEDLCRYDEIVLCNYDLRNLPNAKQFMENLDLVVSRFGKTLTTYGNTYTQYARLSNTSELTALSGMMPVTIGNPDQDKRITAVILDISTSLDNMSALSIAKEAACAVVGALGENDTVMVVGYATDIKMVVPPTPLRSAKTVKGITDKIRSWTAREGTKLKDAMEYAYSEIKKLGYREKQMIIITDGKMYKRAEGVKCYNLAAQYTQDNIKISAIGILTALMNDERTNVNAFLSGMVQNDYSDGKDVFYLPVTTKQDVSLNMVEISESSTDIKVEGAVGGYPVTIKNRTDAVVKNVEKLAAINGFWYSANKPSATSVLTARYDIDKLTYSNVPLYSYWNYGNGRVNSFLSDISGSWTANWYGENENTFFSNLKVNSVPQTHTDCPINLTTETSGGNTRILINTASAQSRAIVNVVVITPDQSEIKFTTNPGILTDSKTLVRDGTYYYADFDSTQLGRYYVSLVYDLDEIHYESSASFAIPYSVEYDCFASYSIAPLYRLISDNGTVYKGEDMTNGNLKIDNSDSAMLLYTLDFKLPLFMAAVIMFVIDIIVRKLRWRDIQTLINFFRKLFAGGGKA